LAVGLKVCSDLACGGKLKGSQVNETGGKKQNDNGDPVKNLSQLMKSGPKFEKQ